MTLSLGAIQMSMSADVGGNLATAERLVREAAAQGARIILIPELFEDVYFCKDVDAKHLQRAHPVDGHPTVARFSALARPLMSWM